MTAAEREAEMVAAADEAWEAVSGRQLVGYLVGWLAFAGVCVVLAWVAAVVGG